MNPQSIVIAVASLVFLTTIVSPPSLLDDVDSTYAQIARTMLESGDWVTARINGVAYFDKPPAQVWAIAASFAIFGVHDWAARIPLAIASILLCWTTFRLGTWAFNEQAGAWAGLSLATCVGLWLFTRVRIPDAALALTITIAIAALLRLMETKPHTGWSTLFGGAVGVGTLIKGLPAVVFPVGAFLLFIAATREVKLPGLRPLWTLAAFTLIAAPWHLAAIAAHPPYFDFTLSSGPGQYRGFFWRYLINEHLLRYLGLRYPRDYNTVPQLYYWGMHLIWLFPWSAYFPTLPKLNYRPSDRAGRARLMALCWIAFVTIFFALSTSQEYYTLSAYPAIALLIGDAIAHRARGARIIATTATAALAAIIALLALTASTPATGDISSALTQNPEAYTLSLGHMQDLTLESFAYLRGPLALAAAAFLIGAFTCWKFSDRRALAGAVIMMALFFQAARWAMVSFDANLSSRPLADAYQREPPGQLILDDQYYSFSSLVFYTNQPVLLLNGRINNIEYGSNAPDAPDVFLDDNELANLWNGPGRMYLATFDERLAELQPHLKSTRTVVSAGGKTLLANH